MESRKLAVAAAVLSLTLFCLLAPASAADAAADSNIVVLVVSLLALTAILKPFTFPGGEEVEDMSSAILMILAVLAYFYGIDFFPADSVLGFFHIITIGLVNAMAMVDLFITTVLGIPLSTDFLLVIVLPAMIIFRLSRFILKYSVMLSDRTTYFISLVMSFLSIVAAATGVFNPINWFFGMIAALVSYFIGNSDLLYVITTRAFIACLFVVSLGALVEFMSTIFVEKVVGSMGS